MAWLIGMSVPGDDDIQAKAQEDLALLKALSPSSGASVRSENSCLSFPHFISTSGGPR